MRRPHYAVTSYEYAGDQTVDAGIGRVELRGPYNVTGRGDTPSRRAIFTCRPPEDAVYTISDPELASRLSCFLWSSLPDDALLGLAERGELRRPRVLEAQVARMLADPRAGALVDNFGGQWLYLRNMALVSPDPYAFADFDANLREAMAREMELCLDSQRREVHSVLELLTSNQTFVNQRLAEHYDIPNIYGNHFRRITLDGALDPRRGLLGKASLLTVTSYAHRTSPVVRGK